MQNNYLVSTTLMIANKNLTITGNTFAGLVEMVGGNTPSENIADYAGNVNLLTRPTGVVKFVRPNKYEQGRGHVVIFNWSGLSAVDVDLSSILMVGEAFEVRDAQNFFGPPIVTGTYAGGTVSIPMTSTLMVPPVGITPLYFHTSSEFGAFVVVPPGVVPGSIGSPVVSAPTISPNGGNSSASVSVSLLTGTPGASIYYTTDDSSPTTASTLYTSPFTLKSNTTVMAKAVKAGLTDSPVVSASFTIDPAPGAVQRSAFRGAALRFERRGSVAYDGPAGHLCLLGQ